MTDVAIAPSQATDPNGRDPVRTPLQWDMTAPSAGFSRGRPWLPVPTHGVDIAGQQRDPDSLLNLYRRLLQLRHRHPCLRSDSYHDVPAGPDVYAYQRADGNNKLLVLLNFADTHRPAGITRDQIGDTARLTLSTHRREIGTVIEPRDLILQPNEATIIEPDPTPT